MSLTYKQIGDAHAEGRTQTNSFVKAVTQTTASGIWYDLSMSSGNPIAQYYSGPTLTSKALTRSADVGLNHGQPVSSGGYKKYLHKMEIQTVGATAAPLTVLVLDYLMFYSGISMDAGVQEFTTNIPIPRYPGGDGVQMMLIELFPYAGSSTFQVTYTNSQGVAGRQTPIVTINTQTSFGTVASSAPTTAGASGLFLPLACGCNGVAYPTSIEFFGAGDVGVLALALVKPIASAYIYENTSPSQFDFSYMYQALPEVKDDAYLNMVCLPVGTLAAQSILGSITTIWS